MSAVRDRLEPSPARRTSRVCSRFRFASRSDSGLSVTQQKRRGAGQSGSLFFVRGFSGSVSGVRVLPDLRASANPPGRREIWFPRPAENPRLNPCRSFPASGLPGTTRAISRSPEWKSPHPTMRWRRTGARLQSAQARVAVAAPESITSPSCMPGEAAELNTRKVSSRATEAPTLTFIFAGEKSRPGTLNSTSKVRDFRRVITERYDDFAARLLVHRNCGRLQGQRGVLGATRTDTASSKVNDAAGRMRACAWLNCAPSASIASSAESPGMASAGTAHPIRNQRGLISYPLRSSGAAGHPAKPSARAACADATAPQSRAAKTRR